MQIYSVAPVSVYLQKPAPVTVLFAHAPAADKVCASTDLVQQSSGIPIVTKIEGATSLGEVKPYFQGRRSLLVSTVSFFKLELNGLMYCSGAGKGPDTSGSSFGSAVAGKNERRYLDQDEASGQLWEFK